MIKGFPFTPKVDEDAMCGTVVLAAVLGIECDEAIDLMKTAYPTGWNGGTNVGHLRHAIEFKGHIFHCANAYWKGRHGFKKPVGDGHPVALFIQIDGPWVAKGWRSAYNHTHWILVHKDMVLDVNNINFTLKEDGSVDDVYPWMTIDEWAHGPMAMLVEYLQGTGWYIRGGYIVF